MVTYGGFEKKLVVVMASEVVPETKDRWRLIKEYILLKE